MANNCLVTKLKSVVDNNTLIKIGEFKLKLMHLLLHSLQLKVVLTTAIPT